MTDPKAAPSCSASTQEATNASHGYYLVIIDAIVLVLVLGHYHVLVLIFLVVFLIWFGSVPLCSSPGPCHYHILVYALVF